MLAHTLLKDFTPTSGRSPGLALARDLPVASMTFKLLRPRTAGTAAGRTTADQRSEPPGPAPLAGPS